MAAAPDRIVIIWADPEIRRYKLDHVDNVEVASESEARRFMALTGADIAGLPYAMMTDRHGSKCADLRGPLSPDQVNRLQASCGDDRQGSSGP